jgi:hypothetical protein
MDPTGAGGAGLVPVADLNKWSLDMKRDQVDVTAFGDVNKQYVLGLPDVKGTYGGWWNTTSSPALFAVAKGDVAAMLNLVPSTLDPANFFEGLGYLDASIEVASDGGISINGSFVAAGPWELEPAA